MLPGITLEAALVGSHFALSLLLGSLTLHAHHVGPANLRIKAAVCMCLQFLVLCCSPRDFGKTAQQLGLLLLHDRVHVHNGGLPMRLGVLEVVGCLLLILLQSSACHLVV